MIYILFAAGLGSSLYFSLQGVLWATNILIGVLCLNIFGVLRSVLIVVGLQHSILKNSEEQIRLLKESFNKIDPGILVLMRVFLLLCVFHLYTIGYVFFAGVAGTTTLLSVLVSIVRIFDMREKKG